MKNLLRGVVLLVLAAETFAASPAAPAKPSPAQLQTQAQRCRTLLQKSLVQFYLPGALDSVNGGFLESLDAQGKFRYNGERFLVMQGRDLWFFSNLALEGFAGGPLQAAHNGYHFLQQRMRDPQNGGYYSKVTDAGAPKDPRKHAYLQSFALYGLVSYFRASHDPSALQAAQQLFQVLEAKAYDRVNGGYNEFFYANWQSITDPKEQGYVGAIGVKTYNTHLHLMESFADLYKVWPDELVRRRLQELITINANTVKVAGYDCNIDAYQPNWQPVREARNFRASYGHDLECVWLVQETLRGLQMPIAPYRNWADALTRYSISYGFDREHGGFYASGPLGQGADDTQKIFWVEAEALVSMLEMYRVTGNTEYYDIFSRTLDFVEKNQVAPEGGWWSSRNADGSAANNMQRSTPWQGPYHGGRALMICAQWLGELSRQR